MGFLVLAMASGQGSGDNGLGCGFTGAWSQPDPSLTPRLGDPGTCWRPRAILPETRGLRCYALRLSGIVFGQLLAWLGPPRCLWPGRSSRWLRASPWAMALL